MKLRTLLEHVEEAESTGDLNGESPVFAVVRNTTVALDSRDAWHAISIVDVRFDPKNDCVALTANESPDASDISVASLQTRVLAFPNRAIESTVLAGTSSTLDDIASAPPSARVVEAYGDEHGLGLMLWFAGYEEWLKSQG